MIKGKITLKEPIHFIEFDVDKYVAEIDVPGYKKIEYAKDISDTVREHCEFKCSLCGVWISSVMYGPLDGGYFKFCPGCGASMEQEEAND